MKLNNIVIAILSMTYVALANTSFYPYIDVQSAYICKSGGVVDKDPVIQFGGDLYQSLTDDINFHLGTFLNYSFDTIDGWYKEDSTFTEIDGYVGFTYKYNDKLSFLVDLEYLEYPNIIGYDHEWDIHVEGTYKFIKGLKFQLGEYTYIDDTYNYLADIYGKLSYSLKLASFNNKDITAGLYDMIYWRCVDDAPDGFMSNSVGIDLSYANFSIYYKHWFQIDDKVYSDYTHNLADNVVGLSYWYEF